MQQHVILEGYNPHVAIRVVCLRICLLYRSLLCLGRNIKQEQQTSQMSLHEAAKVLGGQV